MLYLILILVSLVLFLGFLLLTVFERNRGMRIAGVSRNHLDAKVARATFVVRHVDWSAFLKDVVRAFLERVAHDVAHGVLLIVRIIERTLTRIVKSLRARRGSAPLEDASKEPLTAAMERMRESLTKARITRRREKRQSED